MTDTQRDCDHGSLARSCPLCELQADLAEMRADRDRLAATVERVRALARRLRDSGTHANEACNIENALADEQEQQLDHYCAMCECTYDARLSPSRNHGFGKCVERQAWEDRGLYGE